jgi:hypothetical protein
MEWSHVSDHVDGMGLANIFGPTNELNGFSRVATMEGKTEWNGVTYNALTYSLCRADELDRLTWIKNR